MIRRARPSRKLAAALVVAATLLGACAQTPSGVAAIVNGEQILESDLAEIIANTRTNLEAQGITGLEQLTALRTAQTRNLTGIIQVRILRQEAAKRGIVVSQQEATELWDQQVTVFGSLEDLLARVRELGWSESFAREQVVVGRLAELLQEALRSSIRITQADIQALYDAQPAQWTTRTVSHIQLATVEEASEVLELLAADPQRWDELAEARSMDTSTGPIGGLLGEQPRGAFPEEFDAAVWNGGIGSIVGPLPTSVGFHVVRIEAEDHRALADVAEQLAEQLRGQLFEEQYGSFETAMFSGAAVTVDGRFGEWDANLGEVVFADPLAP